MKRPVAESLLTSFDGGASAEVALEQPATYRFFDGSGVSPMIARGAGLSYAPASFGLGTRTIDCSRFNRFLSYEDGLLRVEAGTTLGAVYRFLMPRDRYLPIQPGHSAITVGGCVAADVHGKNQFKDGTFFDIVEELTLFHPRHGMIRASRTERPDVFDLTCGGYGLTGIIVDVTLRTREIPSHTVEITTVPVPRIEDLPATLLDIAGTSDLVYSWHECTARGEKFGRGFITAGTFQAEQTPNVRDVAAPKRQRALSAEWRGKSPVSFWTTATVPMFNRVYYHAFTRKTAPRHSPLYEFLFPVESKQAYFSLFGRSGFHECQFIIPTGQWQSWVRGVKTYLEKNPVPVTLASAKLFGGRPHLLRFTGSGVCMALDFPRTARNKHFADFLNNLAVDVGAVPNIIKDSSLTAQIVSAAYPDYGRFKTALRQFDPDRLFCSELSERLAL